MIEVPPACPHIQYTLQIPNMASQLPRILCSHEARSFTPEASPFLIISKLARKREIREGFKLTGLQPGFQSDT